MRVEFRVPENHGDPVLERFGDGVLEALGFSVDLVPAVTQHGMEKELDQAVVTDDLERAGSAALGEPGAVVLLVLDPRRPLLGELPQHSADRCRGDGELLGKSGGRSPVGLAGYLEDRLQIVVDCLASHY